MISYCKITIRDLLFQKFRDCGAAYFAIFQKKISTVQAVFKKNAPAALCTVPFSYKKIVTAEGVKKMRLRSGI
jgi:hypothetical protein